MKDFVSSIFVTKRLGLIGDIAALYVEICQAASIPISLSARFAISLKSFPGICERCTLEINQFKTKEELLDRINDRLHGVGLKKGVDLNALRRLEEYLESKPLAKSANFQKPVAKVN